MQHVERAVRLYRQQRERVHGWKRVHHRRVQRRGLCPLRQRGVRDRGNGLLLPRRHLGRRGGIGAQLQSGSERRDRPDGRRGGRRHDRDSTARTRFSSVYGNVTRRDGREVRKPAGPIDHNGAITSFDASVVARTAALAGRHVGEPADRRRRHRGWNHQRLRRVVRGAIRGGIDRPLRRGHQHGRRTGCSAAATPTPTPGFRGADRRATTSRRCRRTRPERTSSGFSTETSRATGGRPADRRRVVRVVRVVAGRAGCDRGGSAEGRDVPARGSVPAERDGDAPPADLSLGGWTAPLRSGERREVTVDLRERRRDPGVGSGPEVRPVTDLDRRGSSRRDRRRLQRRGRRRAWSVARRDVRRGPALRSGDGAHDHDRSNGGHRSAHAAHRRPEPRTKGGSPSDGRGDVLRRPSSSE